MATDIFGGRGPWIIPSTNTAQWGAARAVDADGNLYRLDPETGEPSLIPGAKATPAQLQEAVQHYQRTQQQNQATSDREAAALAAYQQDYADRYNAYQKAANLGVTGSGLVQVGTNATSARDFLNTSIPEAKTVGTETLTPTQPSTDGSKQNVNGALDFRNMSREQFLALPIEQQMQAPSDILASLSNEQLLPIINKGVTEQGSGFLTNFPSSRLATFGAEQINLFLNALKGNPGDKAGGLIADLSNAVKAGGGTPTVTPNAPAAGNSGSQSQPEAPASGDSWADFLKRNPAIAKNKAQHPDWSDQQVVEDWWANTPEKNQWGSLQNAMNQRRETANGPVSNAGPVNTNPNGTNGTTANPSLPGAEGPKKTGNAVAAFNSAPQNGLTAAQMLANGLSMSGLTDDTLEYNFDFANDPLRASNNVLRGMGFNVDAGNPFTNFMANRIPQQAQLAGLRSTLGGNTQNGTRGLLDKLNSTLGSGTFGGGDDIVAGLKDLQDKYSADPTQLSTDQRALGQQLADNPEQAVNYFSLANQDKLSPYLRNNSLIRATNQNLLERYKNAAPNSPNLTALGFLTRGGF